MGDWFTFVALVGKVLDLTASDFAASMVFVSTMLPTFLATPIAGPAVDHFDRRRLMMTVSVLQAGLALTLLAVGPGRVWLAFVAQGSIAALGAFFAPASNAAMPNVVEPEDLPTATALMSSTWGAMLAVGAGLGGLVAAVLGRNAAFVADAVSFVIAAGLVASVRRPTKAATDAARRRMRPLADTRDALRFARSDRPLFALLCSKMGFGLASGLSGIVPVLATRKFGAGDAGIGLLMAGRGAGALIGPLLARRYAQSTAHILTACGAASMVFGGAYLGIPSAPVIGAAALGMVVAHCGGGAQWTLSTYGLQVATPDALRGRILAADLALVTLTLSISSTAAGLISSASGPATAMRILAAIGVAWGAAYLLATRRLRLPTVSGGRSAAS